jgi:hypothetical protein
MALQTWDIRSAGGAFTGLPFAHGQMEAHTRALAHSLPESVDVEVRGEDGGLIASGRGLSGEEETPIALLEIEGATVRRTQVWPTDDDVGEAVILPGVEVGILTAWWHAEDHSQWRWSIELHDHA